MYAKHKRILGSDILTASCPSFLGKYPLFYGICWLYKIEMKAIELKNISSTIYFMSKQDLSDSGEGLE